LKAVMAGISRNIAGPSNEPDAACRRRRALLGARWSVCSTHPRGV